MNMYIARDGTSHGPYPESMVREYLRQGIFQPNEPACVEGEDHWRLLQDYFPHEPSRMLPPPPAAGTRTDDERLEEIVPLPGDPLYANSPARSDVSGERILFNRDGIVISASRFVVNGQIYAMRNITSVQNGNRKEVNPCALGFGLLLLILGLATILISAAMEEGSAGIIGLLAIFIGVGFFAIRNTVYTVVLTTNAGQVQAVSSPRQLDVERVIFALNQAIVGA